MEIRLNRKLEEKLLGLSTSTGRGTDDLVEDALTGYLDELESLRQVLDSRYDDLKSGRVQAVDGELAFARFQAASGRRRDTKQ